MPKECINNEREREREEGELREAGSRTGATIKREINPIDDYASEGVDPFHGSSRPVTG